jgi:hypothetical protein
LARWRHARAADAVVGILLVVGALALVGQTTSGAAAGVGTIAWHGDEGGMTVTVAEQAGPNRVRVEVGITHADDEHLAREAEVSALLTGVDDVVIGPVPLTLVDPDSSRYGAEIDVPYDGEWTVDVDSTNPTAETSAVIIVSDDATATTTWPPAPDTSGVTGSADATGGAADGAPPPSTPGVDADSAAALAAAREIDGRDESGDLATLPLVLVAAVLVAAGVWALLQRRHTGRN